MASAGCLRGGESGCMVEGADSNTEPGARGRAPLSDLTGDDSLDRYPPLHAELGILDCRHMIERLPAMSGCWMGNEPLADSLDCAVTEWQWPISSGSRLLLTREGLPVLGRQIGQFCAPALRSLPCADQTQDGWRGVTLSRSGGGRITDPDRVYLSEGDNHA
jgi:hypothetical protein